MNIDIDVDEVYHAMYQRDKKEMAELLAEDGYCMTWEEVDQANSKAGNALDAEWREQIGKLMNARLRLTAEQEEQILQIIKTFNL